MRAYSLTHRCLIGGRTGLSSFPMGTIPHGIYNNNGHGRGRRVDLYLPGRFSFFYIFSIAALLRSSFLFSFSRPLVLLAREYPSRVRVSAIQSPATVCPPFLSVSIRRGVSSPSRFAPKLRLLEPCRFPDSYVSSLLSFFRLSSPTRPHLRAFFFFSPDSVVNGDIRGAARTTVHLFTTVSIRWINQSM